MATDPIDERYDEIVHGLRALPGAPEELRGRVLELAKAPEPRRPRRHGLGLVVALGLLLVALVAGIVFSSGGGGKSSRSTLRQGEAARQGEVKASGSKAALPALSKHPAVRANPDQRTLGPGTAALGRTHSAAGGGSINLPVNPSRLTEVDASLRLRVASLDALSHATSRAMRITRDLGGFVQSVDYGNASRGNGDAYLTVRVPVAHVQQAVVRFTGLGTIQAQHVSIRDLQDASNAQELQILRLRRTAARIEALLKGTLSPEDRVRLQSQLDAVRGLLRAKTAQHKGTLRQGRLSTFNIELTTRKSAAAAPAHPGRIGRAARHAFSLLSKSIAGVLYTLIVLSPLLVLAAAVLWGARFRRRRVEQRLLARA